MIVRASSTNRAWTVAAACFALTVAAPAAAQSCTGDLDGRDGVDGSDLAIVLGGWGPCTDCVADINDDGIVDGNDLTIILGHWGPCPSPIVEYSMQTIEMPATAVTDRAMSNTLVDFGLQIAADTSAPPSATPITATRFTIWATSVPAVDPFSANPEDQVTGGIGLALAMPLNGIWNRFTGQLQMQVMLDGHYWLLDQYEPSELATCGGPAPSQGHAANEPWMGVMHGFAIESVDPETGDEVLLLDYELHLQPASGAFPTFGSGGGVTVNTDSGVATKKEYPGLDRCEEGRKRNRLVVAIQPVFINYGAGQQTGASFEEMKAKAEEIWGKCCIEFEWKEPKRVSNDAWLDATIGEVLGGIFEHTDMDSRNQDKAIEVMFVKRLVTDGGQPHAHGDGLSSSATGRSVVADDAMNCDPPAVGVLAHELGHAIGGCRHQPIQPPEGPVIPGKDDAAGTVMAVRITTPPACPNVRSSVVKSVQCQKMRSSKQATEKNPKEPCCMTHE